jgi:hypothetical protein
VDAIAGTVVLPKTELMHPKVRQIYEYWRSIHPAEGLPSIQHFDPAAVHTLLPHIWLLDVLRNPYRFRYRLVGGEITAAGGPARRGQLMEEQQGGPIPDRIQSALIDMVERHEPDWYRGRPLAAHVEHIHSLERISLPLAGDGRTVDVILNLSIFNFDG